MSAESTSARNDRKSTWLLWIGSILAVAIIFVLYMKWAGGWNQFESITGLKLPTAATISNTSETVDQYDVDVRRIEVKTDRQTLAKWLRTSPLYGKAEWKKGPIPPSIGRGYVPADILNRTEIRFADFDDMKQTVEVLVVDTDQEQAWLLVISFPSP